MIKQKTAFTLIEIIIALTILGIGLVSVMAYLPVALDASSKASNLTRASLVAQKVIEDIKLAGYSNINAVDAFDTGTYTVDPRYKDLQYKVEVSPLGQANAKDVIVSVRWQSRGKLITETFQTRIPKYNPG